MYASFCHFRTPFFAAVCLLSTFVAASAGTTATTLAITAAGAPVTSIPAGKAITLTATVVSGGAAVSPGVVNFCDATATYCTDVHVLGTAQLTSEGTAIIHFVPGPGSRSFKAVFAGTNSAGGSTSAVAGLTVGPLPSVTTVVASGSTLTANVTGSVSPAPTGTVTILDASDSNRVVGTADLVPGVSVSLSTWPSLTTSNVLSAIPATGDFNNDGITDVAVTAGNGTEFLLGDGKGGFSGADWHHVDLPRHIVSGDFNNDGNVDVAIANNIDNSVAMFLGNGKGVFTAGTTPATGTAPYVITTADFDGDGNADLAVENYGDDSVTILLGHGDGTFTAVSAPFATDSSPISLITTDFNGDGKADLAVLRSDTVAIYLGNGDGTFAKVSTAIKLADAGVAVAAADLDGDGKADLAVLENGSVSLLLGKGNGTFAPIQSWSWSTGGQGSLLVVADLNGDGKPDLAVLDSNGMLTEAYGSGDGTFPQSAISAVFTYFPNAIPRPADSDPSPGPQMLPGYFYGDGHAEIAAMYWAYSAGLTTVKASGTSAAVATDLTLPHDAGGQKLAAHYPGDGNYKASSSGTADLGPFVNLSTKSLTFPPTDVGKVSAYQSVLLTNAGSQTLTIGQILITNTTDIYSWGIRQNGCGATLAPASSCSFDVVFRPTKTGPISGLVSIDDNGQWLKQQILLSGTGK